MFLFLFTADSFSAGAHIDVCSRVPDPTVSFVHTCSGAFIAKLVTLTFGSSRRCSFGLVRCLEFSL